MTQTQEEIIAGLKIKYLEYYKALPIQKLAAGFVGRDEDTIIRWKTDDKEFADQVELKKSEWAKDNATKVRSKEWLLERVMKDHFSPRQELSGPDGESLVVFKANGDTPIKLADSSN